MLFRGQKENNIQARVNNIQVPGDQQPAVHGEPEQHAEEGEADGRRRLGPLLPPRLASGFHVQVSCGIFSLKMLTFLFCVVSFQRRNL